MAKPTQSELKILQILWDQGPCSVRAGYTTTLKLMQIMAEKGHAERDTSSRTHIYSAVVSESEAKKDLLSSFISSTFKGSAKSLVLQALGSGETSQEDLDEIKKLISSIEKSK